MLHPPQFFSFVLSSPPYLPSCLHLHASISRGREVRKRRIVSVGCCRALVERHPLRDAKGGRGIGTRALLISMHVVEEEEEEEEEGEEEEEEEEEEWAYWAC